MALGCVGAVLAGGASTRMGTDKAFIEIEAQPMVARSVAALRAAGAEPVLVVGGDAPRLGSLGLQTLADCYPGQGPLGAVITALAALETLCDPGCEAVVTLPCDVISPDPAAVRFTLDRFAEASAPAAVGTPPPDAAVPLGAGAPQWTHAVWHRRCLSPLSAAFASGTRALHKAAAQLRMIEVEVPATDWFLDADRPEDL